MSTAAVPASSLTEEQRTALKAKILRQVEYYFSDANFPGDKFLNEKAKEDPEGFIPVETIASFNRMKVLTADLDFIKEVLKESDQLVLSPDASKLKRAFPIPDEDTSNPRSIYVKGLAAETTIDDVQSMFDPIAKVLRVRLRRDLNSRKFKGSVFVEFGSAEEAKKAVEARPKQGGKELEIKMKEEWLEEKKKETDEKKSKEAAKAEAKAAREAGGQGGAGGKKDAKGGKPQRPEKPNEKVAGAILKFELKEKDAKVSRETLRKAIEPHAKPEFIEFKISETVGHVRFAGEGSAKTALEKLTGAGVKLAEGEVTLSVLEGEAEEEYWKKIAEGRKRDAGGRGDGGNKRKGGRGGGRGRGRGGRGGRGKRQKTGGDDEGGDGGDGGDMGDD
eukprot:tig00021589_g22722.t1